MYFNSRPLYCAESFDQNFLLDWRSYQNSLTDKLKQMTGETKIQLVYQNWTQPHWWDKYALKIKDQSVFQREIIMTSAGNPYWYARTVIPYKCYERSPEFFARLHNESIRNLIFFESRVRRVQLLNYAVNRQCIEFWWAARYLHVESDLLWVRLAEYIVDESEVFYLVEILLPELETLK